MLDELKQEMDYTFTENGAMTYSSSLDYCLDFFATAGAMRQNPDEEIIASFSKAYAENADVAMKLLFYLRDVRGGLGERKVFRTILKWLAENNPESIEKNVNLIPEYGRWDDALTLLHTKCDQAAVNLMKHQLRQDYQALDNENIGVSLLAKWLPSVNTSNRNAVKEGRYLARSFGMNERTYRKTLSALRKRIDILEKRMCEIDYSFEYSKLPSQAMFRHRKAFYRHDADRYREYLDNVAAGKVTINTNTLMPYEIIRPLYYNYNVDNDEVMAIEQTWNNQIDYAEGTGNTLMVIDGSGSMYSSRYDVAPILIAHSLGLYFAERNTGHFANHFITFSSRPSMVKVRGNNILEKLKNISLYREVANTNIDAVFDIILRTAVKKGLPQEDMPERIIIVSDMQFDSCAEGANISNFLRAKLNYSRAGYKLPKVVFWNVASRGSVIPVRKNEQGVMLVSGCSPRLCQMIMKDALNPYNFMNEILNSKRYAKIVA